MKYEKVDWSQWIDIPDKQSFEDWKEARKLKRAPMTQSAINCARMHVNRLVIDHVCSATQAFEYAASSGWRGIKYAWVVRELNNDMTGFGAPVARAGSAHSDGHYSVASDASSPKLFN